MFALGNKSMNNGVHEISAPLAQQVKVMQSLLVEQLGIPGMKVGGTRRLLIPASEAYGASPPSGSNIPANAPLVFDVTLLAVKS